MPSSKSRPLRELRSPTTNSSKPSSSPRTPTITNSNKFSPGNDMEDIPEISCIMGAGVSNGGKTVETETKNEKTHHHVTFSTATSPKEFLTMGGAVFKPFSSPGGTSCRASDASSEKEVKWKIRQEGYLEDVPSLDVDLEDEEKPSHCLSSLSGNSAVILYMSAFAIIGSSARVYLGRIFGYDCEFPPPEQDYLSVLSTCVTSTGLTEQRGGALFIDLPANMLGSFLMGLVTPMFDDIPVLPWLKADHRLQKYSAVHLSLRTALCGSLTTFASWNTQMIIMLVGRQGILGPQVIQALFGYLMGVACAVGSMQFGRHLGIILHAWRNGSSLSSSADAAIGADTFGASFDEDDVENNTVDTNVFSVTRSTNSSFSPFKRQKQLKSNKKSSVNILCHTTDVIVHGKYSPFVFTAMLLALFFVGDFKMNSSFHKDMWVCALFAPPGTLLRWRLSLINGKWCRDSELLRYFPFGTFCANIMACAISASMAAAIYAMERDASENTTRTAIIMYLLKGLKTGFAGNLSTVSTFAKEIVLLAEKSNVGPAYFYACVTIFFCCLISLAFYLPISGSY